MQFYSLTFLYIFLPVSLIVYNLIPKKHKNLAVAVISMLFFILAQPQYAWLFAAEILVQYAFSKGMSRFSEDAKKKKTVFTAAIITNMAVMLGFSVMNQIAGMEMPLGTMVISFTAIGYFVDVYKGESDYINSFDDFAVFMGFFGKLYRGPLVRNEKREDLTGEKTFSIEKTGEGLCLFLRGMAKYVLLATPIKRVYDSLCEANVEEISVVGEWASIIALGMMIFYDLSGFCDMARGLGLCFGMSLEKNFYYPFQSPSVTDFLDRFNMTVTGFFRHYVYDNLHTKEHSALQFVVDTLLISMLCGVWFGIRMNYVFWGLYIAFFIIIEGLFLNKVLEKIPSFFARIYTFCVTMLSMTLFSASTIGPLDAFKAMFGFGAQIITDRVYYVISENVLVLIVGAFFLSSVFDIITRNIKKKNAFLYNSVCVAESFVFLVLVTAELI